MESSSFSQPLYYLKLREDEESFPTHCPYSQGKPSKVVFKSLRNLKIPGGSRNSQSCDAEFANVESPCMHFLPPQKYPRNTCSIIRRQTRTMSRNNLRGITSEICPSWHPLLIKTYDNKPQDKKKTLKWWNRTTLKCGPTSPCKCMNVYA